ncbi:MAG: tetratricopeptide repeat protein [Armatimonadetes bacterium]|nr:tetratricopeptide repeat protein [Armatimonadota bacterium]
MSLAPAGIVTFLFTDIEDSISLWECRPQAMRRALDRHNALLADAVSRHGGRVFKTMGDAFCAVFAGACEALRAAVEAQAALQAEAWEAECPLRVRMALHTGAAEERDGDYFGASLGRVSRLLSAAHGGQVLLSLAAAEACEALPDGVTLRDLGTHRLRGLAQPERILQVVRLGLRDDFPPLRSLNAFSHNLPAPLTSFIGREREMTEVKGLLARSPLLTLTGSGGCGKTRLALEVAADLVEAYPEGVWLVELAALTDSRLTPQAVAAAVGVREEPGRPLTETLAGALQPRSLLLVLDNCEHLLDACAALAAFLLGRCPRLRILATSQEALGVGGERAWRVPSLALPDQVTPRASDSLAQNESVRLFADRAALGQPGFALTAQNVSGVVQICRQLDGIPLAIELAAARVGVLPVDRLASRLSDSFRLLTRGSRTVLPRHQTLQATMDWSYALLTETERAVLCRLSVFAGGWTLEVAEQVCADDSVPPDEATEALFRLADKSLVVVEDDAEGGGRCRLLETIRQYGGERLVALNEAPAMRRRHYDWALAWARDSDARLLSAEQAEALGRLQREQDNLRAALEWAATDGTPAEELRLASVLWRFWFFRGHLSEGRDRLARALARPQGAGPEDLRAERARALTGRGVFAYFQGDLADAAFQCAQSLALAREVGDRWAVAVSLSVLGIPVYLGGDYAQARVLLEESLALARELEDAWLTVVALSNLGSLAFYQGDHTRATTLLAESIALARAVGEKWSLFNSLYTLSLVALGQGDAGEAGAHLREGLALCRELGYQPGVAACLQGLASVWGAQGRVRDAARLLGAGEALLNTLGAALPPALAAGYPQTVAALHTALGEEAFTAARAEGAALPTEQAVQAALAERNG